MKLKSNQLIMFQAIAGKDSDGQDSILNVLTNGKADISAITEIRYKNSTAVIVKT